MKITHYLYNAFIIETDYKKIAIDPGALFFIFFDSQHLFPRLNGKTLHTFLLPMVTLIITGMQTGWQTHLMRR